MVATKNGQSRDTQNEHGHNKTTTKKSKKWVLLGHELTYFVTHTKTNVLHFNTQKTTDQATRTPLKSGGELMWSGRVGSLSSSGGIFLKISSTSLCTNPYSERLSICVLLV